MEQYRQARARPARFADADDGSVAPLWAMSLVAIFGFTALTYDVGRLNAVHGELQSFADHVALAAAGELDGQADAITRATNAAANMVSDRQSFATGTQALSGATDYTLTFYSAIPASDSTPLQLSDVTNDPADAIFAAVSVAPRSLTLGFLAALDGMLGNGNRGQATQISASAVAAMTQAQCDVAVMVFCVPSANWDAEANIGAMVNLRTSGGGGAWGAGNFGWADPSSKSLGTSCDGLTGQNQIRCLVGGNLDISQCAIGNGVDTAPGQKTGNYESALNVRFDAYDSGMKKYSSDSFYAPAPNVVQGATAGGGGKGKKKKGGGGGGGSLPTIGLPRDTCFASGSCANGNRFGDGVWDYATYIDTNHGNANGSLQPGEDSHLTSIAVDAKYAGTRYETYLREIAYADSLGTGADILSGRAETGRPVNATSYSSDPRRRVFIAAGVDCTANPLSGKETDVPVAQYVELFMTEPVGDAGGGDKDVFAEIIGSAGGDGYGGAGDGGIFRDIVQLYR